MTITPNDISAEFWALLHRMGLPEAVTSVTIYMKTGEPVRVAAQFYLTNPDGELRLVEGAIEAVSDEFVIVRRSDLPAISAA